MTKKYSNLDKAKLKRRLNYHYRYFDNSKISPDPLEFPHRFTNFYDIEISAFISSLFAYGNIQQIMKILNKLHDVMGESPYDFVMNFSRKQSESLFLDAYHRFYTSEDVIAVYEGLKKVYETYGSLKYLFILYYFDTAPTLKSAIHFFSDNLFNVSVKNYKSTNGLKFMFPDSFKGSACKRMNLFMRWMVRKDELDFGLWKEIKPHQLLIPVDTHIAAICKELKLTTKKNVSWLMAEEITNNLKVFDPIDPVKYDFAICHIGMRKMKF